MNDPVEHPRHYCSNKSGVEVIEITERLDFCLGNAVKYLARARHRPETEAQDLKKALWYLRRAQGSTFQKVTGDVYWNRTITKFVEGEPGSYQVAIGKILRAVTYTSDWGSREYIDEAIKTITMSLLKEESAKP